MSKEPQFDTGLNVVDDNLLYSVLSPCVAQTPLKETVNRTSCFMPRVRCILQRIRSSLTSSQGVFQRRERVSSLIYVLFALHLLVVSLVLYPMLTSNKRYDGYLIAFALGIILHWLLLRGECILSYLEKHLFYVMGSAPVRHWVMDVLLPNLSTAAAVAVPFSLAASISYIIYRNTRFKWGELDHVLHFGDYRLQLSAQIKR